SRRQEPSPVCAARRARKAVTRSGVASVLPPSTTTTSASGAQTATFSSVARRHRSSFKTGKIFERRMEPFLLLSPSVIMAPVGQLLGKSPPCESKPGPGDSLPYKRGINFYYPSGLFFLRRP